MSKITESQRKYFVQRVQDQIDDSIRVLEHKNASKTIEISEKQYDNYLSELGVKDRLARLVKLKNESLKLTDEMQPILDTVRKSLQVKQSDYNYDQWVFVSESTQARDWTKAFKQCCDKAAIQSEGITKIGRHIIKLKEKKKQAVDFLYGFSDEAELKQGVNRILTGTGITLLQEKN